jgi:hypothetical protein
MDATTPGFWMLPTKGRVLTSLPRTLRAMAAMGVSTPGVVLVNDREYAACAHDYDALELPAGWTIMPCVGDAFPDKQAAALAELMTPDVEWVGWIGDDSTPETPQWDIRLISQLTGWNFVSSNDCLHAPDKMGSCTAFSADLIRAVGYLDLPGSRHMYCDDLWETIGREVGVWRADMSVVVRHHHASVGGVNDDTTKAANKSFEGDRAAFHRWMQHEKAPAIGRIFEMIEGRGVPIVKPDFTGMKIMLACPAGDGRFDRVFMRSFVQTRDAVKFFGGDIFLVELPYQSAIDVARNTLFGEFLRSDFTHCFWIDSDQGWTVKDFIRLLVVKKDFVAAAGIKKSAVPAFAVNISDERGNYKRIDNVSDEGLIEVTHVGFAFACVTRAWAVRMSQHYADLAYTNLTRATDYGIFMPFIFNQRYMAEDFAACQRWLDIGGKIYVAPEISLEHVGVRVFKGDWLNQMITVSEAEQRAAA